jgi:hypothetical protein
MILTTYDRGVADGERKGEQKGRREALHEMIVQLASPHCGAASEGELVSLRQIEDLDRLRSLVRLATTARSWDELLASK